MRLNIFYLIFDSPERAQAWYRIFAEPHIFQARFVNWKPNSESLT